MLCVLIVHNGRRELSNSPEDYAGNAVQPRRRSLCDARGGMMLAALGGLQMRLI